jgi:hypothetical protein
LRLPLWTASEIDAGLRPPQRLAGCGARAARQSSCTLLDDAFLYEIRGYMSSEKRASVYFRGLRRLSGAVGSGIREHVAALATVETTYQDAAVS